VCSLPIKKAKRKKPSMLNKATANDGSDHQHHHQINIGDILLHSESKITIIQVVSQSTSSLTFDKPIIRRLSPNSSGTNGVQTIVPCDVKNIPPLKDSHERLKTSSTKKFMRMQKAGLALVKELKSKVITPNHSEQKPFTIITADDNERTHL
jgi:hypothetical protein